MRDAINQAGMHYARDMMLHPQQQQREQMHRTPRSLALLKTMDGPEFNGENALERRIPQLGKGARLLIDFLVWGYLDNSLRHSKSGTLPHLLG